MKQNRVVVNKMAAAFMRAVDEAVDEGVNTGKVGKHVINFRAAHNMPQKQVPRHTAVSADRSLPRDAMGYIGMNMGQQG